MQITCKTLLYRSSGNSRFLPRRLPCSGMSSITSENICLARNDGFFDFELNGTTAFHPLRHCERGNRPLMIHTTFPSVAIRSGCHADNLQNVAVPVAGECAFSPEEIAVLGYEQHNI